MTRQQKGLSTLLVLCVPRRGRQAREDVQSSVAACRGGQGSICAWARMYRDVSTKRQLCHCFRPCRGSRRGATPCWRKHGWRNPGGASNRRTSISFFMFPFPSLLSLSCRPARSGYLSFFPSCLSLPCGWFGGPVGRMPVPFATWNKLHFPTASGPANLYISPVVPFAPRVVVRVLDPPPSLLPSLLHSRGTATRTGR